MTKPYLKCRDCLYSDSPCVPEDYKLDACPNYKNIFDAYAELEVENERQRVELEALKGETPWKDIKEKSESIKENREYGIYSDRYFPSEENWQLHHIFVVDVDNPSVYVHFCEEHEREVEETVKNDECFICRLLKNEDSTVTRVIKRGTNEDWYIAEYPKSVNLRQLQEIVKWFNAKYNANCKSYFVN